MAHYVRITSLRQGAREIGLSPVAVRNFVLFGAAPQVTTAERLRAWYQAHVEKPSFP